MAGSDPSGIRRAGRSALLVGGFVTLTAAFALLIDVPALRGLYNYQSWFVPGHWVAMQLNNSAGEEDRTCLFVGTSVVREGFDSSVLSDASDGAFLVSNIATTAPIAPTGVIEVQAQIARDRGVTFECVVLGFNGYYLRDLAKASYEMISTDYVSQLPIWSVMQLSNIDQVARQLPEIVARSLYPLGRHSMILQRGARHALSILHHRIVGRLPATSFEVFSGEFTPAVQFQYAGKPSAYEEAVVQRRQEIEREDWSDPSLYDGPEARAAFIRTVELLSETTDNLYVLSMPLAHVYEPVEAAARSSFELASAGLPIDAFITCHFGQAAEDLVFHDSGHLNASGRHQLSQEVGGVVARLLSGQGGGSNLCEVRRNR